MQRYWTFGSLAFFLLSAWGLAHLTIGQQRARHLAAAAVQLADADERVERAASPEELAAAKARRETVRNEYLASIGDPAERERQRQAFAAEDREEASGDNAPAESSDPPESSQAPQ